MSIRKPTESGPHKDQTAPSATGTSRMRSVTACEKLCEVHDRVRVAADRVSRDIDDLTNPGVPIEISDEDSMVIVLDTMIKQNKAASSR